MAPVTIPSGLRLVEPELSLLPQFQAMVDAARAAGDGQGDGFALASASIIRREEKTYLDRLRNLELGIDLPEGFVPMSTRWLLDQSGALVGETRIRHRLSPGLEIEGGHVGYLIHPAHRGRGYGHAILALALQELEALNVRCVLITCNADNVRSRRVIERNGGVFDRFTISPRTGKQVMRFWINRQ